MKTKRVKAKKQGIVTKLRKPKTKSSNSVCKGIQKSVDSVLLSLPPKVQANIDQMLKSLDRGPFRFQDLQALGYRILKHASEISETLNRTTIVPKKRRGAKA